MNKIENLLEEAQRDFGLKLEQIIREQRGIEEEKISKDPYKLARKALDERCKDIVKQCEQEVTRAMLQSGIPCDPSYEDVAKEIVIALDKMQYGKGNEGEKGIYKEWEKTLKHYCPYCGGFLTEGGRVNLQRRGIKNG